MSTTTRSSMNVDVSQFAGFGACDAADALVWTGISNGGAIPFLVQQSGDLSIRHNVSIAGPAYTVEYAPLSDPRPAVKQHYIDDAPTGSVILIATSPETQLSQAPYTTLTNSLYGGLMSTRAAYLGCVGTVVLGQIRDVAEHRALNYPVWSYGLGVCAPNKLAKVVAVNEPLKVGERSIYPGDIVVADENGVVAIPQQLAGPVLDYMPQRTEADTFAADDIANGERAAIAQKNRRAVLPSYSG